MKLHKNTLFGLGTALRPFPVLPTLTFILAASLLVGCVVLPDPSRARERHNAIGTVTVSAPLFTPLEDSVQGDKRLAFGELRLETNLFNFIHQSSMKETLFLQNIFSAGLSARFGAGNVSNNQAPQSNSNFTQNITVIQPPTNIFASSSNTFLLPPDEWATLIAAYKTYMVNLEDYYNVDSYGYAKGLVSDYLPYKVHFTVTADPGWFTQYHPYDAVVELHFEGANDGRDYKILTVAPIETAQTIDQMSAQLKQIALTLSVEGVIKNLGAKIDVNNMRQLAQKLEGIRSHRTMSMSFLNEDTVRIRIRPYESPQPGVNTLQPSSRILTAVVLVRNRSNTSNISTVPSTALAPPLIIGNKSEDEKGAESELKKARNTLEYSVNKINTIFRNINKSNADHITGPVLPNMLDDELSLEGQNSIHDWFALNNTQALSNANKADKSTLTYALDQYVKAMADVRLKRNATKKHMPQFTEAKCFVGVNGYFCPAIKDRDGKRSAPGYYMTRSGVYVDQTLFQDNSTRYTVPVPKWYGPIKKEIVLKASGYYWGTFNYANTNAEAKATGANLDTLKSELARWNDIYRIFTNQIANLMAGNLTNLTMSIKTNLDTIERLTKESGQKADIIAIRGAVDRLDRSIRDQTEGQTSRIIAAMGSSGLWNAVTNTLGKITAREDELGKALQKSKAATLTIKPGTNGIEVAKGIITYAISAPDVCMDSDERVEYGDLWGRVMGASIDDEEKPFTYLGRGNAAGTLNVAAIDLRMINQKDFSGAAYPEITVFLEVVLAKESDAPKNDRRTIQKSVVQPVVLAPWASQAGVSGNAKPK